MNTIETIRQAGIIGAGGAGFPTYAKLGAKADYLILNGAECEPLIRVDQQLMALYADDVIKGLLICANETEAKNVLIGIKGKHEKAIAALNEAIKSNGCSDKVEVRIIKDAYPAGDEQILVYELTGRIVVEAGIPISVGCVIINAETAINVAKAQRGESVVNKFVTVAGDVPEPITLCVPVGTPIRQVLSMSGIEGFEGYSVIDGGPMMGKVLKNVDGFITKKSKAFIILKNDHPLIIKKTANLEQANRINRAACEQCQMCTDLCPRHLIGHSITPHKSMRSICYSYEGMPLLTTASLCSQCCLCELFSCPAGLFPKNANMKIKADMMMTGEKYTPTKEIYKANSMREYRQVSTKRLIKRLGICKFDRDAKLSEIEFKAELVTISTKQHVGAPDSPSVNVGDMVKKGDIVGQTAPDALGVPIHASIDGIVDAVDSDNVVIRRV